MKLIYVFPLISTLSLYLISNLLGEVLIKGQRLEETGAYFKVREIHHVKFQSLFLFLSFSTMKMKHKTPYNQKKKKKKKK